MDNTMKHFFVIIHGTTNLAFWTFGQFEFEGNTYKYLIA
jgi:hypothetical protein